MPKRFDRPIGELRQSLMMWLILGLSLALLTATTAGAQESDAPKPEKLFNSEDTLEVTMTAPWSDVRNKKDNRPYPGKLQYVDSTGAQVTLDMTAESRGIKRKELCRYPPIRLRFDKEHVKGSTFRGQKSLKMVTHCEASDRYDQYYILEMVAYRMYNQLTEMSFRVRPLQVRYIESDNGKEVDNRFAFLIEDDSDVAKRNGLKKMRVPKAGLSRLDPQQTALFTLYQYMIGNVDWAALRGPDPEECCHNVKLIGPEPFEKGDTIRPIPYDFDSAGLVDAKYAAPPDGLSIRNVTQRLYRGYCRHNDHLPAARQLILEKESAIMGVLNGESRLDDRTRKKAVKFMDDFFEVARDDKKFDKFVTEKCRK